MTLTWCACLVVVTSFTLSNSWQTDEDIFFILYGKDGSWESLRIRRRDEAGYMMDICEQAHKKSGLGAAVISGSGFDCRVLQHSKGKYKNIDVDLIQYGITIEGPVSTTHRFWYITKGLRKDCVFYLEPVDERARELRLDLNRHICGLKI